MGNSETLKLGEAGEEIIKKANFFENQFRDHA